jgi:hypothetical protein
VLHVVIVDAWIARAHATATAHRVQPLEEVDARCAELANRLIAEARQAHERALVGAVEARLRSQLADETNPRALYVLERICALLAMSR